MVDINLSGSLFMERNRQPIRQWLRPNEDNLVSVVDQDTLCFIPLDSRTEEIAQSAGSCETPPVLSFVMN